MHRGSRQYLNKFTYLSQEYNSAIEWLSEYLNIESHNRLGQYKKIIAEVEKYETNAQSVNAFLEPNNVNLRAAMFEAHEIIEICLSLKTVSETVKIPENNLAKLKKGVISYTQETEQNDPSRDTFFELFVAARLIQNNIPIELSEKKSDIVAHFENYKVFIECKRVRSGSKFSTRLKESLNQLETRYTKGRAKEAGLVFLSIDKLINPELNLISVPNEFALSNYLFERLKKFGTKEFVQNIIKTKPPVKKTLAFIVEASSLFHILNRGQVGISNYYYWSSFFTNSDTPYFDLFEKIENKFRANDEYFAENKQSSPYKTTTFKWSLKDNTKK